MSRPKNTPEQQEAYRLRQLEQQRQRRKLRRIKEGAGRPKMTPEQREDARLRKKENDRQRRSHKARGNGWSRHDGRSMHLRIIPDHVLEEREKRLNAPDTPNSTILGDPKVPRWMSNRDSPVRHPNFGLGVIRGC